MSMHEIVIENHIIFLDADVHTYLHTHICTGMCTYYIKIYTLYIHTLYTCTHIHIQVYVAFYIYI